MNVDLISMTPSVAWDKARTYKDRLSRMKPSMANAEVRAEYETIMKGYEQLARGTPLIDLDDAMARCPLDAKGRPRLAIARADRKQVYVEWKRWESRALFTTDIRNWNKPKESLCVRVNMGRTFNNTLYVRGYALVPMIPPDKRPERGVLEDWHILWEVEQWADQELSVKPDIDPYLLKHVAGSLYAVLAEWDLTPLEQAVMRSRIPVG